MIDDLGAVDSCYRLAGVVGISPRKLTLRQLWKMASGVIRQRRYEMVEMVALTAMLEDIDSHRYCEFGTMDETGRGGPVQLSPELQAQVDLEIEKLRIEQPDLPVFRASDQPPEDVE